VLEVAATTSQAMCILTWRLNPKFRRVRNRDNIGTIKGGSSACDFNRALLARNSVAHKDNRPVMAGNEMSPVRNLFNSDIDQITNF
jgi:hypothetical protein